VRSHPSESDAVLVKLLPRGAGVPTIARIWATVDRDRAAAAAGGTADELPPDELLGAFATLIPTGDEDAPIVLLEPSTEGILAATLVRHGEGPAGRYVAIEDPLDWDRLGPSAAAAGIALSPPAAGPFGRSRLVTAPSLSGLHVVLVDRRAGTIGR
jgi:hypothetical protein